MPRPRKWRCVSTMPSVTHFKPAGVPMGLLEEVCISVDEAEALRLKDLEGLEQEQGAEKMGISRPTFQRILAAARKKVTDGLLNGKAIRIEGGSFELALRRFRCAQGHEWDVPFEAMLGGAPEACPSCDEPNPLPLQPPGPPCGRGRWGRHGGRGRSGGW
jgi:predicted DNA-binding protein (UPF0251 family)